MIRIGSLASGICGLDCAVEDHFGGETVWFAETDKHASTFLAARTDGPNHGDVRLIDYSTVEPIDVLCGGVPCQPSSNAGRRLGEADPRYLGHEYVRAVAALRPRVAILENVDGFRRRGWGPVVRGVASLGYVVRWGTVRASDAGLAHKRARVFVVATAPDADEFHVDGSVAAGAGGWPQPADGGPGGAAGVGKLLPTPTAVQGRNETSGRQPGSQHHSGTTLQDVVFDGRLLPTPDTGTSPNGHGRRGGKPGNGHQSGASLDTAVQLLPTPLGRDSKEASLQPYEHARAGEVDTLPRAVRHRLLPSPTPFTNANDEGVAEWIDRRADVEARTGTRHGIPLPVLAQSVAEGRPLVPPLPRDSLTLPAANGHTAWGPYEAAIRRHERILGRPSPPPTRPDGKDGRPRLNPAFCEWLMAFDEGWVTDPALGIPFTQQLKLLGNAVAQPQARLALALLA